MYFFTAGHVLSGARHAAMDRDIRSPQTIQFGVLNLISKAEMLGLEQGGVCTNMTSVLITLISNLAIVDSLSVTSLIAFYVPLAWQGTCDGCK